MGRRRPRAARRRCRRSRRWRARCRDAGVEVVSYGSYLGMAPADGDDDDGAVDAVLDSRRGARRADGPDLDRARRDARRHPPTTVDASPSAPPRFVDAIAARGPASPRSSSIRGTLTRDRRVGQRAARHARSTRTCGRTGSPIRRCAPTPRWHELARVTPHLAHLHVFAWGAGGHRRSARARRRRRPLAARRLRARRSRRCPAPRPPVRAVRVRPRRRPRAVRRRRARAPLVAARRQLLTPASSA